MGGRQGENGRWSQGSGGDGVGDMWSGRGGKADQRGRTKEGGLSGLCQVTQFSTMVALSSVRNSDVLHWFLFWNIVHC